MREALEVTLIKKDGQTAVKATVGKPWIARLEVVNALSVKQTLLRERRTALYIQTDTINRELARAEVAEDTAARDAARKKLDTIEAGMADCNKQAGEHLVEQYKTILEIPIPATEIDWSKIDHEEAGEAIAFFVTGKRQLPESVTA